MYEYVRLKVARPFTLDRIDFNKKRNRFMFFAEKNTFVIVNHADIFGHLNDEKNFWKLFVEYKKYYNVRVLCCHPAQVSWQHPEIKKYLFFPDHVGTLISWYVNNHYTIFKISEKMWKLLPEEIVEEIWGIACGK